MNYKGNDFYCDVALPKKIPLKIEYESENVLAYHHTKPFWPVHIVVVPKQHIDSLYTVGDDTKHIFDEMIEVIQAIAQHIEKEHGAAAVLTNLGEYQDSKHLHFHITFGKPLES